MKPRFADGQRIRVVRAPEWDTSCEGALGTVEGYSEANRAGTGWEVAVRLEIVEDLRTSAPGDWDVVDDGWRVWLDLDDDPALTALLGDHALALHVDHLPWSSPQRRRERYDPELGE
jgi:hypothetical protein